MLCLAAVNAVVTVDAADTVDAVVVQVDTVFSEADAGDTRLAAAAAGLAALISQCILKAIVVLPACCRHLASETSTLAGTGTGRGKANLLPAKAAASSPPRSSCPTWGRCAHG